MHETTQKIPSLEDAKAYIYSIDFSDIIDKMVYQQGWFRKHALVVCEMYRNFLFLYKKYGKEQMLPPSEDIDEFWHLHVLDTKKYRQDCDAIFGEYFDHYPYFGFDGKTNFTDLEKAFVHMQMLYAKEFNGAQIYEVRNIYSRIAGLVKKIFKTKPRRQSVETTV